MMEFKKIQFRDAESQKKYENYLTQVQATTKRLSAEDRRDILMEINSHIYESNVTTIGTSNEFSHLEKNLEKIGIPKQILKPLVAEKKLKQATNTLNPIHIFQALTLNISFGIIYFLSFILYLFLFCFVLLIFAKVLFPENVGFYYEKGIIFQYGGFIQSGNFQQYEILGNWFIPITLIWATLFYLIIISLLKLKNRISEKKELILTVK